MTDILITAGVFAFIFYLIALLLRAHEYYIILAVGDAKPLQLDDACFPDEGSIDPDKLANYYTSRDMPMLLTTDGTPKALQ